MPEDHGLESENAGVVEHVLISGALGATIGGAEVERRIFVKSTRMLDTLIPGNIFAVSKLLQITITLVGGGINHRCHRSVQSHSLKQDVAAHCVNLEVESRV